MEATQDQNSEGLVLVHVLSTVLDRLCVANAAMARADPGNVTKFHAMKAPGIGILQYLERIHKYASCSNECFILALIYIDRLIQRNNFLLTELNVHRVVITAVLLAAKFFDDAYYNNAYYAKVGGVLVSEMNGLEVDFLFRINFSLHVTPEVFQKYRAELLSQAVTCGNVMFPIQTSVAIAPIAAPVTVAPSPSPPLATTITSPPVAVTGVTTNTSPPLVCNPQAPATHNANNCYAPATQSNLVAPENPFAQAPSSQITPPPVPTQMAYVPTATEAPITFPIQFTDGFAQVQRAHSCPASDGCYPLATTMAPAAPRSDTSSFSAPAIITPAVHYPLTTPSNVAAMIEHQIFPLQTALVHHNHHHPHHSAAGNVHHYHPAFTIQPKADPRGPGMLTGGIL